MMVGSLYFEVTTKIGIQLEVLLVNCTLIAELRPVDVKKSSDQRGHSARPVNYIILQNTKTRHVQWTK